MMLSDFNKKMNMTGATNKNIKTFKKTALDYYSRKNKMK